MQSEPSTCVSKYKPISYKKCCTTEVLTFKKYLLSKSKFVVFSISVPGEGVAVSCKLNGFVSKDVLCLCGEDT